MKIPCPDFSRQALSSRVEISIQISQLLVINKLETRLHLAGAMISGHQGNPLNFLCFCPLLPGAINKLIYSLKCSRKAPLIVTIINSAYNSLITRQSFETPVSPHSGSSRAFTFYPSESGWSLRSPGTTMSGAFPLPYSSTPTWYSLCKTTCYCQT